MESWLQSLGDAVKKAYVTQWKGLDPYQMTAATLVMEGTPEVTHSSPSSTITSTTRPLLQEVEAQERRIYAIAAKHRFRPSPDAAAGL